MKFSHYVTFGILFTVIINGIVSAINGDWGQFGMSLCAFGGWSMVAKYEADERKLNETISS